MSKEHLSFWEMCSEGELHSQTLRPSVAALGLEAQGFSSLHLQGGDGLALPSGFPQAGLASRPPLYPQVTPGRAPTALCAAVPGPGCAPCGLGPPCLLPRPQVKAVWPYTYMAVPRLGQGYVGMRAGVCWQQLPTGPLLGPLVPNLPPVQPVGSDGQLWFLGPCLASACSGRIQAGPVWASIVTNLLLGPISGAPSLIRLCLPCVPELC